MLDKLFFIVYSWLGNRELTKENNQQQLKGDLRK
jgi:hypothetical protein